MRFLVPNVPYCIHPHAQCSRYAHEIGVIELADAAHAQCNIIVELPIGILPFLLEPIFEAGRRLSPPKMLNAACMLRTFKNLTSTSAPHRQ
jgi:hypothetical protein